MQRYRPWGRAGRIPPAAAPPLPGPPLLAQDWRGVAFLHWPVDPDRIAPLLPAHTWPDVLDGATYVGIVAFRVVSTRVAKAVPVGAFTEVNVRLYSVDRYGRQGTVFLSMDADSPHNILAARIAAGLPYMWSDVHADQGGDGPQGFSVRRRLPRGGASARMRVDAGEFITAPTPVQKFVTARWGLHVHHLGRSRWVRIAHRPWRLYHADIAEYTGNLVEAAGVPVDGRAAPFALWSPGTDAEMCPSLIPPARDGRR